MNSNISDSKNIIEHRISATSKDTAIHKPVTAEPAPAAAASAVELKISEHSRGLQALAKSISSEPELDHQKLEQIAQAIAEGSYPIQEDRIIRKLLSGGYDR